jgi:hypothetical protein
VGLMYLGLATDLLHRLTRGQWGRIPGGVESTVPSAGMRAGESWVRNGRFHQPADAGPFADAAVGRR